MIEDACQAPGAMLEGQRAGTFGDVGVLSFGGSKLLTSGRGGAVVTSDAQMAQRIRLYTQRGNDAYPLSEMQAAVLLPQLQQLDVRNADAAGTLWELGDSAGRSSGIRTAMNLRMQRDGWSNQPAFYKSAFLFPERFSESQRSTFCESSRLAGVPSRSGF